MSRLYVPSALLACERRLSEDTAALSRRTEQGLDDQLEARGLAQARLFAAPHPQAYRHTALIYDDELREF